jgi:hypothetical protein
MANFLGWHSLQYPLDAVVDCHAIRISTVGQHDDCDAVDEAPFDEGAKAGRVALVPHALPVTIGD